MKHEIKKIVREGYAEIAKNEGRSCCASRECGDNRVEAISKHIGYSDEELRSAPQGANLGLGCGNPIALANLKKGETVVDLGSGAGFDCFLAAKRVGKKGKVIGVDMTHEMLEKARANALKGNYSNVEFRLGEIENLPVGDNSADTIISNCVINLSPDKKRVFQEAFRVLKPGGKLMVSDIVVLRELPPAIKNSITALVGCLAGAEKKQAYLRLIKSAGFQNIEVLNESAYAVEYMANDPTAKAIIKKVRVPAEKLNQMIHSVVSIKVRAVKRA